MKERILLRVYFTDGDIKEENISLKNYERFLILNNLIVEKVEILKYL